MKTHYLQLWTLEKLVFMNEPTPRQDLLDHPKVSLTPHVGAATGEAQDRIGVELADQIMEVMNIDAK
jgi:D-3-phosphoglycerate dehydrogenase / 2-oxoglutarate reductase